MGVFQANLQNTFWILSKVIRLCTNCVRPRFAYLKNWQPLKYLRRAQSIQRRRILREVDRACAPTIAGHYIFSARSYTPRTACSHGRTCPRQANNAAEHCHATPKSVLAHGCGLPRVFLGSGAVSAFLHNGFPNKISNASKT